MNFWSNFCIFGVRLEHDDVWLPVSIRAWRGWSDSAHRFAVPHPTIHLSHWDWRCSCCCDVINGLLFVVGYLCLYLKHLYEHPEDQGKRCLDGNYTLVNYFLCIHRLFASVGLQSWDPVGDPHQCGVGGFGWNIPQFSQQEHHLFLDPGLWFNLHHHVPSTQLCPIL